MIGWRIIKTGIAVALCIWITQLLKFKHPFYSAIAAVLAMQATIEGSLITGVHRMQGTIVGALTGCVFALIAVRSPWWTGLGLIVTMTVLKYLEWHKEMTIASIVFIAISVNLTGKPLDYAFNRIIDTALGITVAYLVNRWVVPPRLGKNIPRNEGNLDKNEDFLAENAGELTPHQIKDVKAHLTSKKKHLEETDDTLK